MISKCYFKSRLFPSIENLLGFGGESVSRNEGYQIENDECRLHVNCHLASLLTLVTWLVTIIHADGVWAVLKSWHLKKKKGIEAISAVCGKRKGEGLLTAQAEEEN